jgi:hypothetical protein
MVPLSGSSGATPASQGVTRGNDMARAEDRARSSAPRADRPSLADYRICRGRFALAQGFGSDPVTEAAAQDDEWRRAVGCSCSARFLNAS